VALRILGSEEDAQDVSQEVWIRVWKNIHTFRAQSAFSTCLPARQKGARSEEREYDYGGEQMPYYLLAQPPPTTGGEAEPEAALSAERTQPIEAALLEVRAERRAALTLRHMEGLSYSEIAEVLQVPEGTVKGCVSRGWAAMLIALSEKDISARSSTGGVE
jgi:RNA polymerase sigma-70 factor, ECF subfamily